jgi:amino acid transporter
VFASDAMSSVAYAPEEIFLTLSVAGAASYALSPWIGLAREVVLLTVVTSYRQNVHAYPSGRRRLRGRHGQPGRRAGSDGGQRAAGRLHADRGRVDLCGGGEHRRARPVVAEHKVVFAVVAIALLTAVNLRGIRESGAAFAVPVYAFMIGIGTMIIWGLTRVLLLGDDVRRRARTCTCSARATPSPAWRWCCCACARSPRARRR